MLYIAFVKNKPRWQLGDVDLTAKSRKWWNEGEKPAGLRTVGFWGSLSSEAPDVIVFEAESHEDIRKIGRAPGSVTDRPGYLAIHRTASCAVTVADASAAQRREHGAGSGETMG